MGWVKVSVLVNAMVDGMASVTEKVSVGEMKKTEKLSRGYNIHGSILYTPGWLELNENLFLL